MLIYGFRKDLQCRFELGRVYFMSFMGIQVKILGHLNMSNCSKYGPILFKFTTHIQCFKEDSKTLFERDGVYIVSFMGI